MMRAQRAESLRLRLRHAMPTRHAAQRARTAQRHLRAVFSLMLSVHAFTFCLMPFALPPFTPTALIRYLHLISI